MKIKELYKGRYNPKTTRRNGWDYTSSAMYMVTLCTKDRIHWFGCIEDEHMILSDIGRTVAEHWSKIPDHFECVTLDHFVVMPDHMHGIINIRNPYEEICIDPFFSRTSEEKIRKDVGDNASSVETRYIASLQTEQLYQPRNNQYLRTSQPLHHGRVIQKFGPLKKNSLSVIIGSFKASVTRRANKNNHEEFQWQPLFHDHHIQSEQELNAYRKYIDQNPKNWVENNEEADWNDFTPDFS